MSVTVVMGASPNPGRFSHKAVLMLKQYGYDFIPLGNRQGSVGGKEILPIKEKSAIKDVDTITLYMNPQNQAEYIDYMLSLKPRRIIFNPGTENPELIRLALKNGIEVVEDCTLIMLGSRTF